MFRRTTGDDLRRATFELRPHHRFVLILNLATVGVVRIDLSVPCFSQDPAARNSLADHYFRVRPARAVGAVSRQSLSVGAAIRRRLASLLERYAAGEEKSFNQVLAFELACLLTQLQPLVCESAASTAAADRRFRQLLDDIEGHLRQSRTVAIGVRDVTKRLHISASCLQARFCTVFGSSLGTYPRNYRLHLAIDSMRDTRRNFMEIASDLGFPDSATFTRFVRRQTGYTPSEFRRRMIN